MGPLVSLRPGSCRFGCERYRQLRHDARRTRLIEQADAEEAAALAEYRAQQAAGPVKTVPQAEVRRRFGLAAR
jgi:hypothetical protein